MDIDESLQQRTLEEGLPISFSIFPENNINNGNSFHAILLKPTGGKVVRIRKESSFFDLRNISNVWRATPRTIGLTLSNSQASLILHRLLQQPLSSNLNPDSSCFIAFLRFTNTNHANSVHDGLSSEERKNHDSPPGVSDESKIKTGNKRRDRPNSGCTGEEEEEIRNKDKEYKGKEIVHAACIYRDIDGIQMDTKTEKSNKCMDETKTPINVTSAISSFARRTNDVSAEQYFSYYGALIHQQNMLQDYQRTGTYWQAIVGNAADFQDKVVMDVGAGSGILSLFAVQAGAKHVYAVEASGMARWAEHLVAKNPFTADRITVINAKVEEMAPLPDDDSKVDVIVSEPMGTMLLNERMIESLICARNRFLRPGGRMFPQLARLHVALFRDPALFSELHSRIAFWHQTSFYGVDLRPLLGPATDAAFAQVVVDCFDPSLLLLNVEAAAVGSKDEGKRNERSGGEGGKNDEEKGNGENKEKDSERNINNHNHHNHNNNYNNSNSNRNHGADETAKKETERTSKASSSKDRQFTCHGVATQIFNLNTCSEHDLQDVIIEIDTEVETEGEVHGLAVWFDVLFDGSSAPVWLSTAPGMPVTHWFQQRCVLQTPLVIAKPKTRVKGHMHMKAHNRQSFDIEVELSVMSDDELEPKQTSRGVFDLKDPYYRQLTPQGNGGAWWWPTPIEGVPGTGAAEMNPT
eukprot:CAMPEP_0175067820 /NCGR_PEP_ID=MMETSP0052_2-20121109/17315_1 /TAXON_ID=51329 ORGANISM="Polytomella parva, Strain SAG 63-3" /NCGR_SAMPLE_ID=MMETSP0052_2 /ASSEMBLY_ACC=CAM_ASM_000194 /LENGTH=692 /DNA_ID=CAMNT_0016334753 /DNA_START=30 /DNA_END=2108 /DNA_ORIENTATION=+